MPDKTDSRRLIDLKAALAKAKPRDLISLDACAALWGVTKPRFVTKRKEMAGFPDMKERNGNEHLYPAKAALKCMIAFIERHAENNRSRAKRLGELVGTDQMAAHMTGHFSIAELAKANQLGAELEQRQREQGMYVPIVDVQRVIGTVFSEISEFVSNLSNIVDPHGRLSPDTRALIDSNGHEQLLRFHAELKGMLSTDALDRRVGKPAGKPRAAPARRKRTGSRTRKA